MWLGTSFQSCCVPLVTGNSSQEGDAASLESFLFLEEEMMWYSGEGAVGGDYSLLESLHILKDLVRVVGQGFKEPLKCKQHFIRIWLSGFYFLYRSFL